MNKFICFALEHFMTVFICVLAKLCFRKFMLIFCFKNKLACHHENRPDFRPIVFHTILSGNSLTFRISDRDRLIANLIAELGMLTG